MGQPGNPPAKPARQLIRPAASTPTDRPWPAAPSRNAGGRASDDPADTFVWPARPGLEGTGSGGGGPGGYGSGGGGGNGTGTGNGAANPPGLPGLPRGGRAGVEAQDGALAGGPYPPARNGLGRGGSGVDPVPLGTPILDPDNPYDNVGAGSGTAGSHRSGGAPAFGLTSGSPGGGAADSNSSANGGAQQPAGGARLIPVSPGGLPGLEDPSGGGGAGRMPNATGSGGGWRAVDPKPEALLDGKRGHATRGNARTEPRIWPA